MKHPTTPIREKRGKVTVNRSQMENICRALEYDKKHNKGGAHLSGYTIDVEASQILPLPVKRKKGK